jgi:hypothetical protein
MRGEVYFVKANEGCMKSTPHISAEMMRERRRFGRLG